MNLKPVIDWTGKTALSRVVIKKKGQGWEIEHYRKMLDSRNREVWILAKQIYADELIEDCR